MRLISIAVAFMLSGSLLADTITLRNGRVMQGTYLGGTARQVRLDDGSQIRTVDVDDIARIEFSAPAGAQAAPPPPPPAPAPLPPRPAESNVLRPEPANNPAPAARAGVELPAGTN